MNTSSFSRLGIRIVIPVLFLHLLSYSQSPELRLSAFSARDVVSADLSEASPWGDAADGPVRPGWLSSGINPGPPRPKAARNRADRSSSPSAALPVDVTPPTMMCPGNISVDVDAGSCSAIVNYTLPIVYDNVGACSVASLPSFPGFTLLGQLNDKAYYLSTATASFAAATAAAQGIGGHLVAINSLEEQNYVRSLVPSLTIWLGLSDAAVEGTFVWSSGEPLTYTNWFTGQPDNASNQDFVEMLTNGFWYDNLGTPNRRYVVEVSCITPILTAGLPSGSAFPIGVNTVTYQSTDLSGNTSLCSFTVTVMDNVPPVVFCPGNQSLSQGAGCAAVLPDYRSLATASDNCTPAGSIVVTQTPAPGTSVTADQVITITATDASGATGFCTFNVTLVDSEPPSIACPGDLVVDSQAGICGAVVNYSLPTISDNCHSCAPMTLPGYTYLGVFGGHTYFRSTTSSSWAAANTSATNSGGHLLTISSAAENNFFLGLGQHWMGFTDQLVEGVWVWVNNEPVVYTNWDEDEPNNLGGNQDFGLINWTTSNQWDDQGTSNLPHILEFDCAASAVPPVVVSGLAPGNVFPTGTTLVTFSATDASGNSAQCSFNVTVTDTQAPVISCPPNVTVNAATGQCSANVSVSSPENMTSIVSACTPVPAGGPCGVGVAQATTGVSIGTGQTYWYSATGTLGSLTMNGGTLRICGALTLSALTFTSGSIFIEPGGSLTVNGTGTINLNGSCTIVNRGSCVINRSVTMQSANNLIANEGSNAVFNMNNANYTLTLNSMTSRFVNTGTASIRTITINNAPTGGICLGFNSTTLVNSLTNNASNSMAAPNGFACLRITGSSVLNNSLTNNSSLNVCRATGSTVSGGGGFGSAVVTLNCGGCAPQPAVNDNCPGVVVTNSFNDTANASGTYPIGVTEVVWTATDAAGNSNSCTQIITVNDNQPPVVNCPGNITTANTQGQCGSFVTFELTATDNCGTTTITQTAGLPSGSLFPVGMTTNTFSVTDPSGNSTTCSFTVTVQDTEPPVTICQDASVTLGAFPTPTNGSISGIINTYTAVTSLTASSATVASTTGFSAGQKVLLIQMQGAVIETANTSSFGNLTNIAQAGNFEFARISGISGSVITFSNPIANAYSTSGRVQLVTVPEFNNVTVTGQVNAQAWNGTTGGIIAFDALGTVTMNAAINANGAGFRGGVASTNFSSGCPNNTNFAFSGPSPNGGQKGEGISIIAAAQSAGRGKAANGGGGGNEVNAGGAGGSNGGSGGTGGNEFATCNGALGGSGGVSLSSSFSQNKIFMGGGGGGGHQNNSAATAGANGGGIIIITAPAITSNSNIISANGNNATNAGNDGAGGGGAGGTVLLQVNTFNTSTTVQARGGSGGTANTSGGAHGPGGGGGGGLIRHTGAALPPNLTASVTGGANGTSGAAARGSTSGAAGVVSGSLQLPQSGPFVILSANLVNNGSGDNCSIASISVSPQGFDCSDIGPNTVTLTVTDVNGNSSTCTSIVNVVDGIAPTITCPANISTTISSGTCTRSVSTPNPVTSDNCGVVNLSWVLSGATTGSSPNSGINNLGTQVFNAGITTVTYTALDAFGNSSTCSFTVTVADNVAPVITCPPTATISLNASCTASLPSYTGSATVTDNCTAAGLITVVQSPAAGTVLSGAGTTVVTLTATDAAGNSTSCTFDVIRADQTAPVITCPANATLTLNASCNVTLPSYTASAVASDNCTAAGSITITQSPIAGTVVSGTGTTVVTLTATDAAGNSSTCTFNVVTVDQTPPTITCPANQTIALNASCTATLPSYISSAVVTDNCTASGFIVINQSPAAGTTLTGPGTTVVTLTATDASGNVSSCTFNVVQADQTAPAISCPANTTIALNASCTAALPSYISGAIVSDQCTAAGSIMIAQSPAEGTVVSGIGTTVVTLTATDEAGNTSSCTFNVVRTDMIAPIITCPGNQTVASGASCNFTLPSYTGLATASDNCDTSLTLTQSPAAGTVITGSTTITLTATDDAGNSSSCTFQVIPSDQTGPSITCPANQTVALTASCNYTLLNYTGLATAADNCDASVTVTQSPASGTVITETSTVTLTATDDAGNSTSCTFQVIPTDQAAPSITCPANQTVAFTASCDYTLLDYTGLATTADNCDASVTVTQSPVAGTIITGTTIITLTGTDDSGNSASCAFQVIPNDQTPPSIVCPANQTVAFSAGCDYTLPDYTSLALTADDCDAMPDVVQSPAAGTIITGPVSITLTVTDDAGNSASCTFQVIPADQTAPVITCPGNQTVAFTASCNYTLLDYTGLAAAADNCDASVTLTQSPAAGSVITGATTITLTGTDDAGNSTSCTFQVIPTDQTSPGIICPGNQTVAFDSSCSFELPDYTGLAIASDNCDALLTITQSPAPGTIVSGTITVTLTDTDDAGNTGMCTFQVIPIDPTPPSIVCPANQTVAFTAACTYTLPDYTDLATAADNCDVSVAQAPAVGTVITGATIITLTATDSAGNSTSCSFQVIPNDQTAPGITCPPDQTAAFTASCNYTLPDYTGLAAVADNCNGAVTITQSPASGMVITGTTAITLTATDDAGNSASCTFLVIPADMTAPSIDCPADQFLPIDASCEATLPDYTGFAITDDNCDASVTVTQSPAPGTLIAGSTAVILTAADDAGNESSCTFDVTPVDQLAPSIVCPPDQTVAFSASCDFILPDYTTQSATSDNCDTDVVVTQLPAPGTVITANTTLTLTATDDAGNTATCTFQVFKTDLIAPDLTCPADLVIALGSDCTAVLADYTSLASAADNCGGLVTISQSPNPGTVITATATITLTATDEAGNSAMCTFQVMPVDQAAPVVTCPGDQQTTVTGDCEFVLQDYLGLVVATDNCGGSVQLSQSPAPGTIHSSAVVVEVTATDDAGNASTCTFMVNPIDLAAPLITCPADQSVAFGPSCTFELADYTELAVTSDNCGGTISVTQSPAPGAVVSGTTAVTLVATDPAGNSSSCSFDVIPADLDGPVIECPEDTSIPLDASCSLVVPDFITGLSVTDNCSTAIITTQQPAAGAVLTESFTVIVTAVDEAGNSSTCSFDVTAFDDLLPQIACPELLPITTLPGSCQVWVEVPVPVVADGCGVAGVTNDFNGTGDATGLYNAGETLVVFTVTDLSGNAATCNTTISILDIEAPVIVCPDDIETCNTTGVYTLPVMTDNCGIESYSISPPELHPDGVFPVGTSTVQITAWDAAGNETTCFFTVTVPTSEECCLVAPVAGTLTISDTTPCLGDNVILTLESFTGQLAWLVNSTVSSGQYIVHPETSSTLQIPVSELTKVKAMLFFPECDTVFSPVITLVPVSYTFPACPADQTLVKGADCAAQLPDYPLDLGWGLWDGLVSAIQSVPAGPITSDTIVSIALTDACGIQDTCIFNVVLVDETPPVFDANWPTSLDLALSATCVAELPDVLSLGGISDNCTPASEIVLIQSVAQLDAFTFEVTLSATDEIGNSSAHIITLNYTDQEAPAATCPGQIELQVTTGCELPAPDFAVEVTATDNCGVETIVSSIIVGIPLEVGTHPLSFTITDVNGNESQCPSEVVVLDLIVPEVLCPPSAELPLTTSCEIPLPDYTTTVTVIENCSFVINQIPAAGTLLAIGNHTVTVSVEDVGGNATSCSFDITVTDESAPELGNDILVTSCDPDVTVDQPIATDNCLAQVTRIDANGFDLTDTFPVGTTVFTFVAEDTFGNTDTLNLSVQIFELPTLSLDQNALTECSAVGTVDLNTLVNTPDTYTIVGPSVTNGVVDVTGLGGQTIEYTVTATLGQCSVDEIITLTVVEEAYIIYEGDTDLCEGVQVIELNTNCENLTWTVNAPAELLSTQGSSATVTFPSGGVYSIQVDGESGVVCQTTQTLEFVLFEQPEFLEAGPDQVLYLTNTTQLSGESDGNGWLEWSSPVQQIFFNDKASNTTQVSSLPPGTSLIYLSLTNGACPAIYDSLFITVEGLHIPTGISPNGDGYNDTFEIPGITSLSERTLNIFNRWGQLIYTSNAYDNSWGGQTDDGKELPNDTYFYELNIGTEVHRGYVVIKR